MDRAAKKSLLVAIFHAYPEAWWAAQLAGSVSNVLRFR
jgi:hypothetical protein